MAEAHYLSRLILCFRERPRGCKRIGDNAVDRYPRPHQLETQSLDFL